ncbi:MAG TPA: sulfite exporter TauE/SafE family protein [Ilumatobacteraceae bacterium]|nr:sulfite exporter TauE/SafE family protein [Ilumatobacteraceae bacterium]
MFTAGNLILGSIAGLIVGLSKTALPGAALVASPLIAEIVVGRAIPGTTLPLLLAADVFAVAWYRQHARWDLLRPMIISVSVGFAAGAAFFAIVGSSTRVIEVVIGISILLVVLVQSRRMIGRQQPVQPTPVAAAVYGSTGGFTTFVANAAGPILNTYLVSLGLNKEEMVGTSAWFYFSVNAAKVPVYVALGELTSGGRFITGSTLAFDAALMPAVLVGLFGGRRLLHRLPERAFLIGVLVLSAAGAVKLLLP